MSPDRSTGLSGVDLANTAEASFLILLFLSAAALGMLPITRALVSLWSTDPLRSFGALLPIVSGILIVRAWRGLQWQADGTAWGLAPLLLAIAVARASSGAWIAYRFGDTQIDPFQPGLLLFLYMSGAVLLLGGRPLWRASLFPLCLLLLVDPVPHVFNTWIDMPLQIVSANVARAFAHLLGLRPTGEQLRLMFTPRFGMQIVPGCNGMRGAATMAYAALLLGYLRRYRPLAIAALVAAAALLGYLLNFLRLCALVIFYWAGTHFQALQPREWIVDYCIGGALFLLVSGLAGWLWLGGDSAAALPVAQRPVDWPTVLRRPSLGVAALLLGLLSVSETPAAYAALRGPGAGVAPQAAIAQLPLTAGRWTRGALSLGTQLNQPKWMWAEYRRDDGRQVGLGIWLSPFQHFAIVSERVQGVTPNWQGALAATAKNGVPVQLASFAVLDDTTTTAEPTPTFYAETTCVPEHCTDRFAGFNRMGLSVAIGPVAMRSVLRLSLMARVRHPGAADITNSMRAQDEDSVRDLLRNIDTRTMTSELGSR